jgi:hypothetical protein
MFPEGIWKVTVESPESSAPDVSVGSVSVTVVVTVAVVVTVVVTVETAGIRLVAAA